MSSEGAPAPESPTRLVSPQAFIQAYQGAFQRVEQAISRLTQRLDGSYQLIAACEGDPRADLFRPQRNADLGFVSRLRSLRGVLRSAAQVYLSSEDPNQTAAVLFGAMNSVALTLDRHADRWSSTWLSGNPADPLRLQNGSLSNANGS